MMNKTHFKAELEKWHTTFCRGQRFWSIMYHSTLFGSLLCSVGAGAALQFDLPQEKAIASVLASIAAALTGLAAAGRFDRKWRSNRLSRSRLDCLLLDLELDDTNIPNLANKLKNIISTHDQEIVKDPSVQTEESALKHIMKP